MSDKVVKTEEQWREQLTDIQYHVARERGTEHPFTGEYTAEKRVGEYRCIGCDKPLFSSEGKYDSGCGWPSFYESLPGDGVATAEDNSHSIRRVEILCSKCDSHLGHVFPDGPQPTGTRFCVNSASLSFQPTEDSE